MIQIYDRYHKSDTLVLVHTGWLPGAVRATQRSFGDLVTPTWITCRDAQFDDEKGKERSKEEIGHL